MNNKQLERLAEKLKGGGLTKNAVMYCLDVSERKARNALSEIAKIYPLIAVSDTCGYRIATSAADLDDVRHAYNENRKRAAEILKRNKPLVTFIREHGEMT